MKALFSVETDLLVAGNDKTEIEGTYAVEIDVAMFKKIRRNKTLKHVDGEIVVVLRDVVVVVPKQLTRYQFMAQLADQGDLATFEDFVRAQPDVIRARADSAGIWKRDHTLFNDSLPLLAAHSGDDKWDSAYVDQIFINGKKLTD